MRARTLLLTLAAALAACGGGGDTSGPPPVDDRINNVKFVTTYVGTSIYDGGSFQVVVVPIDGAGQSVLEEGFSVSARVVSPPGLSVTVLSSSCIQLRERRQLATGVVIDDSSSMAQSDPSDATGVAPGRKAAARLLIDAMQAGDTMTLSDFFGTSATPLRDLVCVLSDPTPGACPVTDASFIGDQATLRSATEMIENFLDTPFYNACMQMSDVLSRQPQRQRAMVVLSDGLAHDEQARMACLDAAHTAGVTIYTVGFGQSDVTTLRELAEATGGAFVASSDRTRLEQLISEMPYSGGSCSVKLSLSGAEQLPDETPITIDLSIGDQGAHVTFEILSPRR